MDTRDAAAGPSQAEDNVSGRGRLVIAAKVVEKIASNAAGDLDAVGGSSGGFLGIGGHNELSTRPRASVHLSGQVATIELAVGVKYPAPLQRISEQLRQHVRSQVTGLTGIDVRQVDVEISWLLPGGTGQRGRRLE